jgi:hypothetical protein
MGAYYVTRFVDESSTDCEEHSFGMTLEEALHFFSVERKNYPNAPICMGYTPSDKVDSPPDSKELAK